MPTAGARAVVTPATSLLATAGPGSILPTAPTAGVGAPSLVMAGGTQTVGIASAIVNAHTPYGCAPYLYNPPGVLWRSPAQAGWWRPLQWNGSWCATGAGMWNNYCDQRYAWGFGWCYTPDQWCDTWYPSYRVYGYYPWNYYDGCTTPVIATVWHATSAVPVVETSDPYVEFDPSGVASDPEPPAAEDRPGLASRPAPLTFNRGGGLPATGASVPSSFGNALLGAAPVFAGVGDAEAAAQRASNEGKWLEAAEAWRQTWAAVPECASSAYRMGLCLAAAGRHDLSVEALRHAVALEDGKPTRRVDDVRIVFGATTTPAAVRARLEMRVTETPGDRDARFLLGWFQLAAGDAYAARNEWALLASSSPGDVVVAALRDLAERTFVETPR